MEKIKVLVQGPARYVDVFNRIPGVAAVSVQNMRQKDIEEAMNNCNVVCLTGGSDVSPRLYNQKRHKCTHFNDYRDTSDILLAEAAMKEGKGLVGICRGAQLLCVIAGGSLIQDVSDHAVTYKTGHDITTINGRKIHVTSTHHQMMHPTPAMHSLLAWGEGLSDYYKIEEDKDCTMLDFLTESGTVKEPEVVWFPNIHGLAVQFHPETMDKETDGAKYFEELLWEFVF